MIKCAECDEDMKITDSYINDCIFDTLATHNTYYRCPMCTHMIRIVKVVDRPDITITTVSSVDVFD